MSLDTALLNENAWRSHESYTALLNEMVRRIVESVHPQQYHLVRLGRTGRDGAG